MQRFKTNAERFLDLKNGIKAHCNSTEIAKQVDNANSFDELWGILFADIPEIHDKVVNCLFPFYYPESNHMSASFRSANVWYFCIRNAPDKFRRYLDTGLFPSQSDLSIINTQNNSNAWRYIFSRNQLVSSAAQLFDNNIYPDSDALSICDITLNTNSWHWLASNKLRHILLWRVLKKNILPTQQDLGVISLDDHTNAWYWLSLLEDGILFFQELLDKNIWPSATDLNRLYHNEKCNIWLLLTNTALGFKLFLRLMDHGIIPDVSILNSCDMASKINVWDRLFNSAISREHFFIPEIIFNRLLSMGIEPPDEINLVEPGTMKFSWYLLSQSEAHLNYFRALIAINKYPWVSTLNTYASNGDTIWHRLMRLPTGIFIIDQLLAKGLLPTSIALNANQNVSHNFWTALFSHHQKNPDLVNFLFLFLLNKNILPNNNILSATNGAWSFLLTNSEHKILAQALIDKGLIPHTNALTAAKWAKHYSDQLYAFDVIPPTNAVNDVRLSQYYDRVKSVMDLCKNIDASEYNRAALLLTRSDVMQIYGFLYLLYRMLTHGKQVLPKDLIFMIGKYLLPPYFQREHFMELLTEKSMKIFTRFHLCNELDKYTNSTAFLFFKHKRAYRKRAASLRADINTNRNPGAVCHTQFLMSLFPRQTPYLLSIVRRQNQEHALPFRDRVQEEAFNNILCDGARLHRTLSRK